VLIRDKGRAFQQGSSKKADDSAGGSGRGRVEVGRKTSSAGVSKLLQGRHGWAGLRTSKWLRGRMQIRAQVLNVKKKN
jgi:hypothetical protein